MFAYFSNIGTFETTLFSYFISVLILIPLNSYEILYFPVSWSVNLRQSSKSSVLTKVKLLTLYSCFRPNTIHIEWSAWLRRQLIQNQKNQ